MFLPEKDRDRKHSKVKRMTEKDGGEKTDQKNKIVRLLQVKTHMHAEQRPVRFCLCSHFSCSLLTVKTVKFAHM